MVADPLTTVERLTRFIDLVHENLDRFSTNRRNQLGFAFADIMRYWQFLDLILGRYRHVNDAYVDSTRRFMEESRKKPGPRDLSEEEAAELTVGEQLQLSLHLEIESFYVFARILLDKVVQAFVHFFGSGDFAVQSHRKILAVIPSVGLTKIEAYAASKQLTPFPTTLKGRMLRLVPSLIEFRDQVIVHDKSPRGLKGTGFNLTEGSSYMVYSRINPRAGDVQHDGLPLPSLMQEISEYINEMLSYIEANFDKCAVDGPS